MRDLFVTGLVLGTIPLTFMRPWFGALAWFWLAFMNPHRMTWGFAYNEQFSMLVGASLLLSWLLRGEKNLPKTTVTALIFVYFAWTCVTTVAALDPGAAGWKFDRFWKTLATTMVTVCLINNRQKFGILVWVASLSLGFHGIKGGIFTLMHGGNYKVWGPANSFISDNNQLAMALLMLLPYFRYLSIHAASYYVRWALLAGACLLFASILGSQSRGALVGAVAMGAFLWLKSRNKVLMTILTALGIMFTASFMPQSWFDRMDSIRNYEEDGSAQGRIDAWTFSVKLANARLLGGGFGIHGNPHFYWQYYPEGKSPRAAHSVYFETLGEQGWIGLVLFMSLFFATWMSYWRTRRMVRRRPDLKDIRDFCLMSQVSLIGFASAGAFLNLSTFDFYWLVVAYALMVRRVALQELAKDKMEPAASARERADEAPALGGAEPVPVGGGASGFLIKRA